MKGQDVGESLIFVFLIIFAIAVLIMALPVILKTMGMEEWGTLVKNIQDMEKYGEEGVTISLPNYVERVEIIPGNDRGECNHAKKGVCSFCEGATGGTFITIWINPEEQPDASSVIGKALTLQFSAAKKKAMEMFIESMCIPKKFKVQFDQSMSAEFTDVNTKGIRVLRGDPDKIKQYCIKIEKKTAYNILYLKEGKC